MSLLDFSHPCESLSPQLASLRTPLQLILVQVKDHHPLEEARDIELIRALPLDFLQIKTLVTLSMAVEIPTLKEKESHF